MQHIDAQLSDPRDHLALDETLLLAAEAGDFGESLRVWELPRHVVVAGRSTRIQEEIHTEFCANAGIEVLRRCSGGAAVVAGPGCLMYSLVLRLDGREELRKIDLAHRYVMKRVLNTLRKQVAEADLNGTCDLTWKDRKCSGNSLRVARNHLLYHGTLLYDFELSVIARCLKVAPRQPEYRRGRDHEQFVTNVEVDSSRFAVDLCVEFSAERAASASSLMPQVSELRKKRYDDSAWNFRH